MGNAFGYVFENGYNLCFHPDVTPHPLKESQFDPNLGFPNGRKERVMMATVAEMQSAKLKPENRDYCAHLLLKYMACRKDKWPWPVLCQHEKHGYLSCQHEDYILRMKEFERERRLMIREKKRREITITA